MERLHKCPQASLGSDASGFDSDFEAEAALNAGGSFQKGLSSLAEATNLGYDIRRAVYDLGYDYPVPAPNLKRLAQKRWGKRRRLDSMVLLRGDSRSTGAGEIEEGGRGVVEAVPKMWED